MRMVIYVLAVLMSALFMGCGTDDGLSVGDVGIFCYDKSIGYSEVSQNKYSQYRDQWYRESCSGGYIGSDCISHDNGYTLTIRECVEAELTDVK